MQYDAIYTWKLLISTAYSVYRVRDIQELSPDYLNYLVRSSHFQWELQVRSKGIWISRLQLTDDSFLNAPFPLPTLEEQAAIVRYLSHADHRIRKLIAAKQRMIRLLQEQKQVIIHQAVTRGLDPDVRLKPSGVEWLGDVPEGWEVQNLGSLISYRSERNQPDLPLLSVIREKGVILRNRESKEENHNFIPDDLSNYKVVREGDLVINKMKAWQGSMGLAPHDGIVSPAYFVFRFAVPYLPYGAALLRSKAYVALFARASDGVRTGQWDLSIQRMKRIPILIPPASEQRAIVKYINAETAKLNQAITRAEQEIALLREYRTRLIADVVTGKLDVREAAAGLPELEQEGLVEEAVDGELEDATELEEAGSADEE
ncbi:restriction endonuclease subunit S [Deinococcus radiophilus]|uniref:Restriction endonuclease subunit S n=1 Tax=Deinococcus radiophilus TaxID=32062 RepID=A0A431VJI4_9DEIO|nr:restriction endonuclease subunit S [Deinococcus radiophilus]RTR22355.1 restriction endonuclease subunit S [Deinococcus radiophilus]UFA49995.1 restriction endonuclease subunit S [Deinococcus radiophilus]